MSELFKTANVQDDARLAADYERDGVIRVRGLLTESGLKAVDNALEDYRRAVQPGLPASDVVMEADGRSVRNYWRMEQHSAFFRALGEDASLRAFVSRLVHGDPVLVGVELFSKPARVGSAVPPHQDNAYFCQTPSDMLTVWIAIDPATEANGPVTYVRGSQRTLWPHIPSGVAGNSMGLAEPPRYAEDALLVGLLGAGDALIHHSQAIHWSAPNRSDQARRGLLLVYRGSHTQTDPELKAAYAKARG